MKKNKEQWKINLTEEFGIHFKNSKGELQFLEAFIEDLLDEQKAEIEEMILLVDEKREDGMGSISKVRYATPIELKRDIINKLNGS